jgi:hypothetical protein
MSKYIVTLNLKGKSDLVKLVKYKSITLGMDGDVIYAGADPTTISTRLLITDVGTKISDRDVLLVQAKTLTSEITAKMDDLNTIFVDEYAPFVQKQAGNVLAKITETNFSVKDGPTAAPDVVPVVTGFGVTTGSVARSFDAHWDALSNKVAKEYDVRISLNPNDPIPLYTHYLSTKKSKALITDLPLDKEVGVEIVTVGKKDGVESDPCTPIIRMVVNPHS